MCGIFLKLAKNGSKSNVSLLKQIMRRRGPDEINSKLMADVFGSYDLIMMHSRLSITGVDNAIKQPISSDNKHFMFNGEIYNYKYLISKFDLGDPLQSDTDVFWKLIQKIGLNDALQVIDGMYAFVYVSEDTNEIFFGVDHFSQKPLYVYHDEKNFILASEPEYLLSADVTKNLNYNFINNIMQLGYKFRNDFDETELLNLKRIKGNQVYKFKPTDDWISYKTTRVSNRVYQPDLFENDRAKPFYRAVCETLPAEVSFALPLSSGVDSNLLLEIIKKNDQLENFQGVYTVDSDDDRYSEKKYLSETTNELRMANLPHHFINPPVGKSFIYTLRRMVTQRLGFVSGLNYVGQFKMYERMNEDNVRVSLSGVGLDELFTGYYDHYAFHFAQNPNKNFALSWQKNIQPLVRNPWLQSLDVFLKNPNERRHLSENKMNYSHIFKESVADISFSENASLSLLRRRLERELMYEIVPIVLRDDDFNSMYHSVESRAPYLRESIHMISTQYSDDDFFSGDIAKSIPRSFGYKLNRSNSAFKRFHKVGFNLSIWDLITGVESEVLDIIHGSEFVRCYLNYQAFKSVFDRKDNSNYFSKLLFTLLNIAILEEVLS